jgi:hypothetical protein
VCWARNFVESIGDGADQIFHAVTGNGGNRVEFEVALLAESLKLFKACAVSGGVQLSGNDDHRFFDEGWTKGFQFSVDHLKRVDRIIGVGVARIDQMDEEAGAFDVAQETDAEAGA